ncbi:MAG: stress response protein [Desulfobacterales bacterium]|nr:stress response protein [Desulfobacterales bacterium]
MELKQKDAKATIGSFKQLKVSLIWTSPVDLDLMAFYKTKDGKTGGIFSDNYAGGTLGDLNQFPYMQLSGDEGVGGGTGEKSEELRIIRLDDFEEVYICALNFTDATSGSNKVFADYDAKVKVMTDKGEDHTVTLDSKKSGSVAVICKLKGGFIGTDLINDSEVMTFESFNKNVPGASNLKLSSKITLKSKGDKFTLKPKVSTGEVLINLNWNQNPDGKPSFFKKLMGGGQPIDLDLGCLFEMSTGELACIQPLNVGFLKQGSFTEPPYIYHLGDDRTGSWSEGENIKINIEHMDKLKRILIFTFIYEGAPKWNSTDAVVTITVPGQPTLEVPMGVQTDSRSFCAIAMLEFANNNITVTKLVSFHTGHQDCDKAYKWGLQWVAGSKD